MPLQQLITAPRNRVPTTGLIALAELRTDLPEGWETGFGFNPEACDDGIVIEAGACVPPVVDKDVAGNPNAVTYQPVAIVAGDQCSTLDRGRDRTGRARRHLDSIASSQLERVLWTGQPRTGADTDLPRPHLADQNAVQLAGGVAVDPVHGLALLDQALTACLHGVPGMVHVTPYSLTRLVQLDLLRYEGNRWLTPNGHTVVGGAGYTGGGPRPAADQELPDPPNLLANPSSAQWAYGTSMVETLLGDVMQLGTSPAETVERRQNTQLVLYERAAAAIFVCCQFGVQLGWDETYLA